MKRYLLNISYIGTQFRGIQKTIIKGEEPKLDTTTVQGCIEFALTKLKPINPIEICLSSRTDKGVHALHSTVHVDLKNSSNCAYPSHHITKILNREFYRKEFAIRIINTQIVPDTFHCRYNAIGRTYLYRLAIAKNIIKNREDLKDQNFLRFIPVEEKDRCYFLQGDLDIEKVKEASKLFVGRHDFRTFMSISRQNSKQVKPMYTIRNIKEINISSSAPATCSYEYNKVKELYDYWDITITGRSFLYKQVRRIVATLLAVGFGRITNKDVYEMITIPSKYSWDNRIQVMPPFGLYLCKVHYNSEDLQLIEEEEKQENQ